MEPTATTTAEGATLSRTGRADREASIAGLTFAMGLSMLGSSWIAYQSPLPTTWYVANGLLHLTCLAWLVMSTRYRTAGTPLLLSATFLVVVPLLCYGSLAVAFMADESSSPVVLRMPGPFDFAYVTWAALLVSFAGLLGSFVAATRRRPRRPPDTAPDTWAALESGRSPAIPADTADRLWRFGWLLALGSIACYVVFITVQGRSPLDYGIFFGEVGSQTDDELEVLPQFLLAGIDLGIPAVLYLLLGVRRLWPRALVAAAAVSVNLILFANLGFKYRIVVVLLALAIVAEGRRVVVGRGRSIVAAVVLVVAVLGFFVVQVRRGDSANRRPTTIESYADAEYGDIVLSSVDIVTPYAAYHAANLPKLNGRSYYEVPSLAVPKLIWPGKPSPATVETLNRVVPPDTGAVFPLWAEADANLGLIGLALFGLVLGRLVSWVDGISNEKIEWLIARALMTATLPSVLSRPMFFWVVQQVMFVVGPALLFVWLQRPRAGADHARPVRDQRGRRPDPLAAGRLRT